MLKCLSHSDRKHQERKKRGGGGARRAPPLTFAQHESPHLAPALHCRVFMELYEWWGRMRRIFLGKWAFLVILCLLALFVFQENKGQTARTNCTTTKRKLSLGQSFPVFNQEISVQLSRPKGYRYSATVKRIKRLRGGGGKGTLTKQCPQISRATY